MRGGTSKAVFLRESDLPQDEAERERTILAVFGSPDRRQINGLGGADPLTSKLALIGPPRLDDPRAQGTHLSYTFGQVEIAHASVDWNSLCGNISAAVGAYAIYEGYAPAMGPITTVRVFNTNLNRILSVEVPTSGGHPVEDGDYVVAGVPGSGARIQVDFADTAGAATGALLPTGRPIDRLEVPGYGLIDVSLVDTGNAHVFVRASDLGLVGNETAAEIDAQPKLRENLEQIRAAAAIRIGLVAPGRPAHLDSPATPLIAMVAPPMEYRNDLARTIVSASEVDLVSRLMFMQQMHKTYAATSTACTGVAAKIAGTIVHQMARPGGVVVRIGHPAGVIETDSIVAGTGANMSVGRATVARTARRILEGYVFLPSTLPQLADRETPIQGRVS